MIKENEPSRGCAIEEELWVDWEFYLEQRKLARRVNVACGTLLAIIMGFNTWLIWLIWFSR